jgi:hypothetical protein
MFQSGTLSAKSGPMNLKFDNFTYGSPLYNMHDYLLLVLSHLKLYLFLSLGQHLDKNFPGYKKSVGDSQLLLFRKLSRLKELGLSCRLIKGRL